MSPTQALTSFVATTTAASLPAHLFDRANELLLDHGAVVLAGLELPWSRMIRDQALHDGGPAESSLYGGGKVAARNAALANATIAHSIELDDTHIPSLSHMSAVTFPAALAVAEARGASGRDFLLAYIVGCEVMGRIGRAAEQPLLDNGFHPTASLGVFGAAAAAASLMKLSAAQISNAFGLALSMAAGAMQFSLDPEGTMVKRLHAGLPAERGILAAMLAARGFSGPAAAIEGDRGFLKLFAGHQDASRVVDGLGREFMLDDMSVKVNACCLHFAALVDAVSLSQARLSATAESIKSIEVFGPKALLTGHMEYRPRSVMAAQYSLPYVTAATLALDPRDPHSFSDASMARPDIQALSDRVTAREDAELQKLFPAKFPAGVRMELKNGKSAETIVEDGLGTAGRPITRLEIEGKFDALSKSYPQPLRDNLFNAIAEIDRASNVQRLAKGLRLEA